MHAHTPLADMMLPERVSDRRDARTFARSMLLAGDPRSPQADALITTIINHVIVPFRGRKVQVWIGVQKGPPWRGDRRPKGTPHFDGLDSGLGILRRRDRDVGGGDGGTDSA